MAGVLRLHFRVLTALWWCLFKTVSGQEGCYIATPHYCMLWRLGSAFYILRISWCMTRHLPAVSIVRM